MALAGLGRIPISYRSLAAAEGTLALLHAGGLPPKVIGLAADLLALYIVAGVFEESLFEKRGMSEDEIGAVRTRRSTTSTPPCRPTGSR